MTTLNPPSHRNTLGPVSLASLNSRYPQRLSLAPPRKSVVPSRLSFAPHRMSLMSTNGVGILHPSMNTNNGKDPRPIGNKLFTKQCKQYLIAYLQEHDYQDLPTMKSLSSPLCNPIYQILEFLLKQLDPNFSLPTKQIRENKSESNSSQNGVISKHEVDRSAIIQIFKFLGYPYSLTENHFKSIGAMHTWPHVLAALMWLVQLLSGKDFLWESITSNSMKSEEPSYFVPERGAAVTLEDESFSFMRHISMSYQHYMNEQEDEMEHMHKKLELGYKQRISKLRTQIDQTRIEIEESKANLEQYKKSPTELEQLEITRKETLTILEKLNITVDQFRAHEQNTSQALQELQDIHIRLDLELRHLEDLKKDLEKKISQQGITPDDVKRLQEERLSLSKEIKHLESECSDKLSFLNESQHAIQEIQTEFENKVKEYNQLAAIIKLSYTLSVSSLNSQGSILNHDLSDLLERHIRKEKDTLLNRCKVQQTQTYTLDEEIGKKLEEIQDARDENILLEQEVKKSEDRLNQESKDLADQLDRLKLQIDEAEKENIENYSKKLQMLRDELLVARKKHQEADKQYKQLSQIAQQEKQEMSSLILEVMKQMTVFKKCIREILRSVEEAGKKIHEELQ